MCAPGPARLGEPNHTGSLLPTTAITGGGCGRKPDLTPPSYLFHSLGWLVAAKVSTSTAGSRRIGVSVAERYPRCVTEPVGQRPTGRAAFSARQHPAGWAERLGFQSAA